ncbi:MULTISPECIES: beta strand repeat-containing protein [Chryseobacterium]|uniref:beta strand repeat-containing protein n=1 Tax=Chryseobacterium TaxID=59732 RepID=UPI00195604A2|nr:MULTISPECIES: hypothetical protein [Chryseobacterium]MBM7420243.1 hypothetical protein [Chryseobacterium sp. JUb44]WSO08906.1 hypothetical protein VUJ64_13840 [Chryseobacterium scophthalmum]
MKKIIFRLFLFMVLLCTSSNLFAQSDYYWVGGGGSWSDLNHWRIGSSTGPQATIIPSRYDNVFFNNTSGSGTINISPSAICKNFTIDDNIIGNIMFSQGSIFNVYGNLKWRGNVSANYSIIMNLFSDNANPTPNIIDIPGNLIRSGTVNSAYVSSINFSGNGSFSLVNDFNSNGYFSFNIGGDAVFDSNNKNIKVTREITYSSSAVSNFGTSQLTSTELNNPIIFSSYNANANLTQATVSGRGITIPNTQNIKNIVLGGTGRLTVGSHLKADNITGTGSSTLSTSNGTGQYEINTLNLEGGYIGYSTPNNIAKLTVNNMMIGNGTNYFYAKENEINHLTLGNGTSQFSAGKYDINNLTLNGGNYLFRSNTAQDQFKVNQTFIANPSCTGSIPRFGGNPSEYVNLFMPSTINGSTVVNFPGYTLSNVRLTGGASVTAALNGIGNTGSITYTGAPATRTFYRIGGGGLWQDPAKWSLSSGGASANCVPNMYDNVIFDAGSGFTAGNETITSSSQVSVRNMTWDNAPGNPVYNLSTIIYGSVYLQKEMNASISRFYLQKYNSTDPVANRYMSFEGQTISYAAAYGNDNFYIVPASYATSFDVTVTDSFLMDNNGLTGAIFADGIKINAETATVHLGGNTAAINNSIIWARIFYLLTRQPINAPNTSVYVNGEYDGSRLSSASNTHFIGSVYKEGNNTTTISDLRTNLLQVNGSGIILLNADRMTPVFSNNVVINAPTSIHLNIQWRVADTFVYNRADCDLVMNFIGNNFNKNLLLGNNINGTGFVELNRMNISGVNAGYITPVVGEMPVNANNSINNGDNSGINFTAPTAKNFYWKGGAGNWDDLAHWSLDPTSARVTANCGLPTIYDNVFFDQYSDFGANGITGIYLQTNVSVNDLTFSGLAATQRSHFAGNSNNFGISINGDLTLHPGYYDAGYFSGFTFINSYKPAGINKKVYPNGGSSRLIFNANANWKIHHGTGVTDMSGQSGITQNAVVGTLDLSGTVLNLNSASFNGKEVLLNNSDITIGANLTVNTQQPINGLNAILRLYAGISYVGASIFNNLAHFYEKIEIAAQGGAPGHSLAFPAGTINNLNVLAPTGSAPVITLNVQADVNNLKMQQRNNVALASNIKVNQSMLLQGDCIPTNALNFGSDNATLRQIIIPAYNTSDFVIDKVRLKSLSSSGGQTYITSNSIDLGGNTGISFPDAISSASRDLYWIGGQGDWNDLTHWALSSGGTPITGCNPPRANDNIFFDQYSGFTATQKTITISGSAYANNVTFNNAPNTPILNLAGQNLYAYGNLTLQTAMSVSNNSSTGSEIYLIQSTTPGQTRYIDTKGVLLSGNNWTKYLKINAPQDNFELLSELKSNIDGNNVKSFKTNNYQLTTNRNIRFNYTINNNPVLDFGQSVITDISTYSDSGLSITSSYPVSVSALDSKITVRNFILNIPNVTDYGEVNIIGGGTMNAGTVFHNFNKLTFLGGGTLSSPGNYNTLYFNPGNYKIASGQNITGNLFMTGTPCNRISVSRTAASGQSAINLDPAVNYTMFYASVQDMNFSHPLNAYGNSQDLGNTTNLTIVPTNVQAAGFGGNKTLCASEFPKTYDAAALFGTDPNASYTWTKIGNPNAGVISTSPIVTFTQPGNYSVKVVYAQDGCNITENFTISSIAMPVDNTTIATSNALQNPTGDVTVTFKGSLNNQTYIFTYSINNGADIEIISNTSGVATILHPRSTAGTFVYHLKGIRFANGMACPVAISNKNIIVNINPACPTPGVVQLYGTELRGCTASMGARRLAEVSSVTVTNPPADVNVTRLIPGTGIVIKEGADVLLLRNSTALPETLTLPANKPHIEGAIIYHNDRFYEGINNGKWIRIDNE